MAFTQDFVLAGVSSAGRLQKQSSSGGSFISSQLRIDELYGPSNLVTVHDRLTIDGTLDGVDGTKLTVKATANDDTSNTDVVQVLDSSGNTIFSVQPDNSVSVGYGTVSVNGDLSVQGDEVVVGTTTFQGDTDIGDDTSDTLTITAVIDSNVIPSAGTETLGSSASSNQWGGLFLGDGAGTIQIGADQDVQVGWDNTGSKLDFDVTGELEVTTSDVLDIDSDGDITVDTTAATSANDAGDISITGGSSVDGAAGSITITSGASSGTGTDGNITLAPAGQTNLNGNTRVPTTGDFRFARNGAGDATFILPQTNTGSVGAIRIDGAGSFQWHDGSSWQTAGTATGNSLQLAYAAGNTITTSTANGNVDIQLGENSNRFYVDSAAGAGAEYFYLNRNAADALQLWSKVNYLDMGSVGSFYMYTTEPSGGGNTSAINLYSGGPGASYTSGDVNISSGSTSSAASGDINLTTGDASGSASGSIVVTPGSASAGSKGDFSVSVGAITFLATETSDLQFSGTDVTLRTTTSGTITLDSVEDYLITGDSASIVETADADLTVRVTGSSSGDLTLSCSPGDIVVDGTNNFDVDIDGTTDIQTGGTTTIHSSDVTSGASSAITVQTGGTSTASGTNTGALTLGTGNVGASGTGDSGDVSLTSGTVTNTGDDSGAITIGSGSSSGGLTGAISISSGTASGGISGGISLVTGDTPGWGTGSILLETGDTPGLSSGSITLNIGSGATDGVVDFQAGGVSFADFDVQNSEFDFSKVAGWTLRLPDENSTGKTGGVRVDTSGGSGSHTLQWWDGDSWETVGTSGSDTLQEAYEAGSSPHLTTNATGGTLDIDVASTTDFVINSVNGTDYFTFAATDADNMSLSTELSQVDLRAEGNIVVNSDAFVNIYADDYVQFFDSSGTTGVGGVRKGTWEVFVFNSASDGAIAAGDAVYMYNSAGSLQIGKAVATDSKFLGIAAEAVTGSGEDVYVIVSGTDIPINTSDTWANTDIGDEVYLDPDTSGEVTNTAPTASGDWIIRIGFITEGTDKILLAPTAPIEIL